MSWKSLLLGVTLSSISFTVAHLGEATRARSDGVVPTDLFHPEELRRALIEDSVCLSLAGCNGCVVVTLAPLPGEGDLARVAIVASSYLVSDPAEAVQGLTVTPAYGATPTYLVTENYEIRIAPRDGLLWQHVRTPADIAVTGHEILFE